MLDVASKDSSSFVVDSSAKKSYNLRNRVEIAVENWKTCSAMGNQMWKGDAALNEETQIKVRDFFMKRLHKS